MRITFDRTDFDTVHRFTKETKSRKPAVFWRRHGDVSSVTTLVGTFGVSITFSDLKVDSDRILKNENVVSLSVSLYLHEAAAAEEEAKKHGKNILFGWWCVLKKKWQQKINYFNSFICGSSKVLSCTSNNTTTIQDYYKAKQSKA